MSDLLAAKHKLRIEDLGAMHFRGWKPGKSCNNPFREDRNPSFSVFDNGRRWKDFATGESGDAVDFFAKARGLSNTEAVKQFIELAGCSTSTSTTVVRPARKPRAKPVERREIRLPRSMHLGSPEEVAALAELRNVSPEAVELLGGRGLLKFCTLPDGGKLVKAWLMTDKRRVNAQVRRLDGKPWQSLPGQPKAKTLPGSVASWPVGIYEAHDLPVIALVEGAPDMLAAAHFSLCECREDRVAPVAMLGASLKIPEEALALFSGKIVRIFPHLDDAGRGAAVRWYKQLTEAGVEAHCFSLDGIAMTGGGQVNDLNDLTSLDADAFEADRNLWSIFDIAEGGEV